MIQILEDMNKCYGCGACENACPVGAVSMQYNAEGFKEPVIDNEKCIDCKKCQKVCIANKETVCSNTKKPSSYAFAQPMKEMKKSTSGGVFPVLAKHILSRGGSVFGAVYAPDFTVFHTKADSVDEMEPMRMSKYVQSDQKKCYTEAKECLNAGRPVLYVGCPCQIAGLKSFLGKDYENLYTIDLICHGSPSPRILKEHLDKTFGKNKIKRLEMRKRTGWGTCFDVFLTNGKKIFLNSRKEIFMLAFLKNIILRKTCYGCKFAKIPRQGDITLGDFWNRKKLGIELEKNFRKKCSILYLNNEKGEKLYKAAVESYESEVYSYELTNLGFSAAKLNNNFGSPAVVNDDGRTKFFEIYHKKGLERAAYLTLYPDRKERIKTKFEHKRHFREAKKLNGEEKK